jgi:hypothetical protein
VWIPWLAETELHRFRGSWTPRIMPVSAWLAKRFGEGRLACVPERWGRMLRTGGRRHYFCEETSLCQAFKLLGRGEAIIRIGRILKA